MTAHRTSRSASTRPTPSGRDRTESREAAIEAAQETARRIIEAAAVDAACRTLVTRTPGCLRRHEDYLAAAARLIGVARSTLGTWTSETSHIDLSIRAARRIRRRLEKCGAQEEARRFWAEITSDTPGRASDNGQTLGREERS